MVQDALRGYVQIASGIGDVTRQRAVSTARQLLDQGGGMIGSAVATAGSVDWARQVQGLADELIATSRTNRDLLVGIIRTEIERTVARLGLVGADELASMARVVERLQSQLDAAIAFSGRGRGSTATGSVRREPETFGGAATGSVATAKSPARKAPVRKAPARGTASPSTSSRATGSKTTAAGRVGASSTKAEQTQVQRRPRQRRRRLRPSRRPPRRRRCGASRRRRLRPAAGRRRHRRPHREPRPHLDWHLDLDWPLDPDALDPDAPAPERVRDRPPSVGGTATPTRRPVRSSSSRTRPVTAPGSSACRPPRARPRRWEPVRRTPNDRRGPARERARRQVQRARSDSRDAGAAHRLDLPVAQGTDAADTFPGLGRTPSRLTGDGHDRSTRRWRGSPTSTGCRRPSTSRSTRTSTGGSRTRSPTSTTS